MQQAGTVPRSSVRRSVPAPPLLCAVLLAALAGVRGAEAHPVPFSYLDLRLKAGVLEGSVTLHVFDLAHDLDIQPAERLLDPRSRLSAPPQCASLNLSRDEIPALVVGLADDRIAPVPESFA